MALQYTRYRRAPLRTKRKKHKGVILCLVFFMIVGFFVWKNSYHSSDHVQEGSSADVSPEAIVSQENEKKEHVAIHTIEEGDIPAHVFSTYGHYDANDTEALLAASEEVFDFTQLKIGQPIRFYFPDSSDDDTVKAMRMEYDCNTEEMIIAEYSSDAFSVREEKIQYDVKEEVAKGMIDNFFYADALEAGLSEPTVLEVGDIFSFSIDFTTEIQQGDEFVFVYEKRTRDGVAGPDGRILAAKFVNDGKAYYAYHFSNENESSVGGDDGGQSGSANKASRSDAGGYYDGDGHVLERQFLKAPLSYRAITSGFTGTRLHPITRKVSAHYQIDYAAPTGTPVVASARGTVVSAGWEGGWGNMIRLTHDNGYTTHYGHLSTIAKGVTSGTRVNQGQVIGYVGSTGWSTGPHLDYGMKLNGTPINPLTLVQPKGAPLSDNQMGAFNAMKEKYRDILQ